MLTFSEVTSLMSELDLSNLKNIMFKYLLFFFIFKFYIPIFIGHRFKQYIIIRYKTKIAILNPQHKTKISERSE